jgi:hypothetical protein
MEEIPDPKGLPTSVSALSSRHTGDSYSCHPDLEVGAITKWQLGFFTVQHSFTVVPPKSIGLFVCRGESTLMQERGMS